MKIGRFNLIINFIRLSLRCNSCFNPWHANELFIGQCHWMVKHLDVLLRSIDESSLSLARISLPIDGFKVENNASASGKSIDE